MKFLINILILAAIMLQVSSCKKDDDDLSSGSSSQTGQTITADFSGFVKDELGNALPGALVRIGGSTAITNSSGGYKIQHASVNKKRAIVEVTKSGYLKQQKAIIAENGTVNYVNLMLFPDNKSYSINAVSGGVVTLPGGTRFTFPANAFVTSTGSSYNGTVYLTAHEILTSDNNFSAKIPGGDLMATDSSGNETLLVSYGMAGAELYDVAGNKLQLALGKSAAIKFPISPSQSGAAPVLIPLWHYDESVKMWKEEGSATRIGNFYEGTVSHFSWWNCDVPGIYAELTMNLADCQGTPLENRIIRITGNNTSRSDLTNSLGNCTGGVPANVILTVQIFDLDGTVDTSFSIGPLSNQSSNQINIQLISSCDDLVVNLVDCSGAPLSGSVNMYYNGNFLSTYNAIDGLVYIKSVTVGTYSFFAMSGSYMGTDSVIIIGAVVPTITTSNLSLCSLIAPSQNHINAVITDLNGTTNLSSHIIEAKVYPADTSNSGYIIKLIYVNALNQDTTEINFNIPVYNAGTYQWNSFDSFIHGFYFTNNFYQAITSTSNPFSGYTSITAASQPGGMISGTFSGNVDYLMGTGSTVQIMGSFEALRTQ